MRSLPSLSFLLFSLSLTAQQAEQAAASFHENQVRALPWRMLGPANMGGRITDMEIVGPKYSTWYVATAGGGLLKTRNAGTTWQALFQNQSTISIGDVAVAPSNSDIVWVGTGEENARNSVSWGDGVYKSTDGGESFKHMGLRETFQIGHIAIHPENADLVYVAALGRLWGHNPDRGVFRSKDGGETWEKVLFIDDKTGCIDLRIDPENPQRIYAAMYERMRDGFDTNDPAVRFSETSGLYRSDDAGDNWKKLEKGLPTVKWGRTGLSLYHDGSLFAIIETERNGWATGTERIKKSSDRGDAYMGINGQDGDGGAKLTLVTPGGPGDEAGLSPGDLITKIGDKTIGKYAELTAFVGKAEGGSETELTYSRDGVSKTVQLTFGKRERSEASERGPYSGRLGGQNPNVQSAQGDAGFETGGIFRSDDHGETWQRINSLTERPFYYSVIAVDPQDDQNIYSCGVAFYASDDAGENFKTVQAGIHSDFHAVWVDPRNSDHLLLGSDGGLYETYDRTKTWRFINNFVAGQFYHANADNSHPYRIYGGLQDNGTWGGPSRTRYAQGSTIDDWVTIFGGDGFRARIDPEDPSVVFATSQNGGLGRVDIANGRSSGRISKPSGTRFNWDTPFFLSPHNSRIFYYAGSKACRSINRGETSSVISPELGLTERGTATAFAESPLIEGLLYVGTDDGAVWRSDDGGDNWTALQAKVLGMPGPRYVSHIEPSNYQEDRVFITFDGHRSDDLATYVFVSEDRGDTWKSLIGNLPDGPAHVIREYPAGASEDLLFLGTEFGSYVSLDRGEAWFTLGSGLPNLAVRDLDIQLREGELIAATHGRGIWILDITPLTQMTADITAADAHLFEPDPVTIWRSMRRSIQGHDTWTAANPPPGAAIYVYLREIPADAPEVTVHDISGKQIAKISGKPVAGLQLLQWNGRIASAEGGRGARRAGRGRGRRGGFGGRQAPPGNYSIRMEQGGETQTRALILLPDPLDGESPLHRSSSTHPAGYSRPAGRRN
ncbi:MAG: WD40/YVTN/BNR-like repeat-containing protein [Planctomycetota bacterium]|jgi:photosystem II stability/assembly factor-like uncharacterized protein